MEISIRHANKSDSESIAALLGELGFPTANLEVVERLKLVESSSSDVVFVAEVEEQVVAFLSLHVIPYFNIGRPVGRVSALVVSDSVQQRGIGRKLMKAAEDLATELGCVAVEVTSANFRKGAHEFYTRLGYPETSVKFFKYI